MSSHQHLPEDQQTVLALLVDRGMSYQAAAGTLGVSAAAVRDRAQLALAMLAPEQARELASGEREEIGDYMLGQLDPAQEDSTRQLIESSAPASAFAHALSRELAGERGEPAEQPARAAAGAASLAPRASRTSPDAAKRRNFALALAGVVALVAIALAVVLSKGSSNSSKSKTQPKIVGHAIMASPTGARTAGLFEVLKGGSKLAYYVAAVGLEPTKGFYYALWLKNGSQTKALNRAPSVGANGRIVGGALLPANATSYREVLLTRETQTSSIPATPGETVLKGTIKYAR